MSLRHLQPLFTLTLALSVSSAVLASPTGLNNIPTADVVPEGVLVLQQFTNFGSDQIAVFIGGLKYGAAHRFEIGLDDRIGTANSGAGSVGVAGAGGAPAGPPVFQIKYRVLDDDKRLSAAVGVANISWSDRAGDEALYIALKRNVSNRVRGHLGFLTSGGSDAFFLGADGDLGAKGWVWRADGIQVNDGDDWLSSVGVIGPLSKDWLVEGWVSIPSQSGVNETFTLKFDYIFGN